MFTSTYFAAVTPEKSWRVGRKSSRVQRTIGELLDDGRPREEESPRNDSPRDEGPDEKAEILPDTSPATPDSPAVKVSTQAMQSRLIMAATLMKNIPFF